MIGIDNEKLDSIIENNKNNSEIYSLNISSYVEKISDLLKCYGGTSLGHLFCGLEDECDRLKLMASVIDGYTNVLVEVRKGYYSQNQLFIEQVNHLSSSLGRN